MQGLQVRGKLGKNDKTRIKILYNICDLDVTRLQCMWMYDDLRYVHTLIDEIVIRHNVAARSAVSRAIIMALR